MKNSKNTKKALVFSCLSVVLCLTMLIGSTFAWFTDNASTNVNTIQAGTLDIALEMLDGTNWVDAAGETLGFVKAADAPDDEEVLWEPGCTYELEQLRVKNNGNLALKFKVIINTIGDDEDAQKLAEVLDVLLGDTKVGTLADMMTASATDPDGFIHGTLLAGITSEPYAISLHMQETAGNAYQRLTIDGISVTVLATQDTVEYDSSDNQYDAQAVYPVASAAEMKEALANGGIVSVNKDIKTDNIGDNAADRITISQPTTLNLDAKIISPDDMGNNSTNFCALIVDDDTTINAGENGGINTGRNGGYALNVRMGANLTITGGSYYGGGTAVQVQEGTLTITGGHFAVEAFGEPYGYNFLLNCVDSAYKNGSAKIIVKGGTFVNFNPSENSAEGASTNFVADGYTVVSVTQGNGDVWYTVVPA